MPPNTIEIPVGPEPELRVNGAKVENEATPPRLTSPPQLHYEKKYKLIIFQASIVQLAHILIGMTVSIAMCYGFRNGLPIGPTPLHIVLCVIGYQLLMAEAILALNTENGWTSKLRLVDKRRAHWILQILGSGLAIGGSFHKILDKDVHWNTLHGRFALVALVFTSVSLVNGLASLYAYEFRKVLPGNISKLTHICFGTVAFAASSICLCFGFDKAGFKVWSTEAIANTFIAFVATFTFIIIINPLITFYNKSLNVIKK